MRLIKPKFWDLNYLTYQSILLYPFTFIIDIKDLITFYVKPKNYNKIKTICVGNIYLGGTGKTPLVDFLAKNLKRKFKTAIIKKKYQSHLDEKRLLEKSNKVAERNVSVVKSIYFPELKAGIINRKTGNNNGYTGFNVGLNIPLSFWSNNAKIRQQKIIKEEVTFENESKKIAIQNNFKSLQSQIKYLENELGSYLDSKDQPGLRYRNMAIIKEDKIKRKVKKKSLQHGDSIKFLQDQGISNPEMILGGILEARRGDPSSEFKFKYKKYTRKSI